MNRVVMGNLVYRFASLIRADIDADGLWADYREMLGKRDDDPLSTEERTELEKLVYVEARRLFQRAVNIGCTRK